MIRYDNCKGCHNMDCEHYGKDREFVCPKGISCKAEHKIEGSYNMNKVELNWIRLYKNAPLETRKASKKHWIEVLQRAIRDDNESLRSAAQFRLAQMTIIEYSESEE